MHPAIRTIGKVLRLVGISSPEDAEASRKANAELPSWKIAKASKSDAAQVETKSVE